MKEYTEKVKLINRLYFQIQQAAITNVERNNQWKKSEVDQNCNT